MHSLQGVSVESNLQNPIYHMLTVALDIKEAQFQFHFTYSVTRFAFQHCFEFLTSNIPFIIVVKYDSRRNLNVFTISVTYSYIRGDLVI